jgi:P-type Ca2+ transporter type 2C
LGIKTLNNSHQLQTAQVLQHQATDARHGLSQREALRRQLMYGVNALIDQALKNPWQILWEQLTASTVLLLVVAAFVSALLKDDQDAVAILAEMGGGSSVAKKREAKMTHDLP